MSICAYGKPNLLKGVTRSFAQSRTSGELHVQRRRFVRKTIVPKGLRPLLHPNAYLTPEFPLEGLLEVLGVLVSHCRVLFLRL